MVGTKERSFAPFVNVILEELVPHDHFYRHLERILDLTFVQESYAGKGHLRILALLFVVCSHGKSEPL